jgi:polar amino acid transport system permease protein
VADLFALLQFGPEGWGDELAYGALVTVTLALVTMPVGFGLGFIVALGRQSRDPLVRLTCQGYVNLLRGTPELLTLFLVYFGAQYGLSQLTNALFGAPFEFSPFVAGVIALGLATSSYASEVFLSAMRGIPHEQYDASFAVGLTRFQTVRLVIAPQVLRLALPGLSNLWLSLLKETSLVSVISLNDLLRQTSLAVGSTKEPLFFYAVACAIYLVISVVSSLGLWRIDRWAARGHVR